MSNSFDFLVIENDRLNYLYGYKEYFIEGFKLLLKKEKLKFLKDEINSEVRFLKYYNRQNSIG